MSKFLERASNAFLGNSQERAREEKLEAQSSLSTKFNKKYPGRTPVEVFQEATGTQFTSAAQMESLDLNTLDASQTQMVRDVLQHHLRLKEIDGVGLIPPMRNAAAVIGERKRPDDSTLFFEEPDARTAAAADVIFGDGGGSKE